MTTEADVLTLIPLSLFLIRKQSVAVAYLHNWEVSTVSTYQIYHMNACKQNFVINHTEICNNEFLPEGLRANKIIDRSQNTRPNKFEHFPRFHIATVTKGPLAFTQGLAVRAVRDPHLQLRD
jgi:hypothetical protein